MTRNPHSLKSCWVLLPVLLSACGAEVQSGTGNTNWHIDCNTSSDCPNDLVCECQLCGPSCEGTIECRSQGEVPLCVEAEPQSASDSSEPEPNSSEPEPEPSNTDSMSSGLEPEPESSSPEPEATSTDPDCPSFPGGVQEPIAVETSAEVIPQVTELASLLVEEDGIYWLDRAGAIYSLPHGESEARMLRAAPAEPPVVLGFISDATTLYWAEADQPEGVIEPGPPPPPGRFYKVSKSAGPATLLLGSADYTIVPRASDGDRIIASLEWGSNPGVYEIPKAGGEPQPLELPGPSAAPSIIDGQVYWLDESQPQNLFRANLSGSEPELVTSVGNNIGLAIGQGVVLWKQSESVLEPLTLVENFVMFTESSGCSQPLPSLGETISSSIVLDETHVYWQSFNGLGSSSPGEAYPLTPLVRVNLQSGVFERLSSPGFEAKLTDNLYADDDEKLYLSVDGGLVAVSKP